MDEPGCIAGEPGANNIQHKKQFAIFGNQWKSIGEIGQQDQSYTAAADNVVVIQWIQVEVKLVVEQRQIPFF